MRWGLVIALLILFVGAAWHSRRPLAIRGNDGLIYVSLSQSLEHGSYRDTYLVGSPIHKKYPPAYPLWLIPLRHLGDSFDVIRLANLLLAALAILVFYGIVRRFLDPWLAVVPVLLLAATPVLQDWSTSLMAESLFSILAMGTLALCFLSDRKNSSALPAMLLAWLAFLTRTAGLALIVAVGLWLLRRRKPLELVVFGLGSLLVVGGWLVYTQLLTGDSFNLSYGPDLAALGSDQSGGVVGSTLTNALNNAVLYITEYVPFSLALPTVRGTLLDNFAWLLVLAVLLGVGFHTLWREWRAAAWYLPIYGAMLVLWPWPYERFLIPILPLILGTMFLGVAGLTARLGRSAGRVILICLVGLMGFGTLRGSLELEKQRRHCDRSDPLHSTGCYQPEMLSLVRGIEYVGANSDSMDIVMTSEPVTVHYLTGRRALPSALLDDVPSGQAAAALRQLNVRYQILSSVRPADRGPIGRRLSQACRDLRVAASFEPHTLVLEPNTGSDGNPDACDALTRFLEDMKAYGRAP